jgi:ABC-2 type transport system permease protein
LRSATDVQPNFDLYPELGFPIEGEQSTYPLAVSLQGRFESYYQQNPSPFEESFETTAAEDSGDPTASETVYGTIKQSPDNARLVVIGSSEFINDTILQLSSRLGQDRSLNNLQFVQNLVDWSVEDAELLSIRSRGTFTRLLRPLTPQQETFWEVLNYFLALLTLLVLAGLWQLRRRRSQPIQVVPTQVQTGGEA